MFPRIFVAVAVIVGVAIGVGLGIGAGLIGRGPTGQARLPASPASAVSPSASPTIEPTSFPPPSVLTTLHGRIAISSGKPGTGGWISLPGADFTADAGSNVTLADGSSFGLTQVLALNRWVAVPRDWVSPDGTKFVYFDGSAIHVVRARASDLRLTPPDIGVTGVTWTLLWAANTGAFVFPSMPSTPGLWWVSYAGAVRTVIGTGYWTVSDGRYAFGSRTAAMPPGGSNAIVQLDLTSGATADVFSQQGEESTAVGVTLDGSAVVLALTRNPRPTFTSMFQIWIVSPSSSTAVFKVEALADVPQASVPSQFVVYSVVADAMGTWVSTSKGVYLYSSSGFEFVAPVTGTLASAFRA